MPIHYNANTFDGHGNAQIVIQDQYSASFDFMLARNPGLSTVAVATSIEDMAVTVADASSASVGNYCVMFRGTFGYTSLIYVGTILSIATNTITLDTPINYEFQIGDVVLFRDTKIELADGSLTPVIYDLPVPPGIVSIDVTRFIFAIECSTEPDDSLFGNLPALTNGIVLRHNSVTLGIHNFWNIKKNGDMAAFNYDVTYTDKAGGGLFAVRCLMTYNAQPYHGVTVRLNPGDKIELIVQDDLTDLSTFKVVVQGHVVE